MHSQPSSNASTVNETPMAATCSGCQGECFTPHLMKLLPMLMQAIPVIFAPEQFVVDTY